MGAAESKLSFKKGVFRLFEEPNISPADPYWLQFWELPENVADLFSLFGPTDIRRTRDTSLENLETLIMATCSKLFAMRRNPSFPDVETAPANHALNCIRVLTRIMPYVYEKESLARWQTKFFWSSRRRKVRGNSLGDNEVLFDPEMEEHITEDPSESFETVQPLGAELVDTLSDLLFFSGFTLPSMGSKPEKVNYVIWETGVGCTVPIGTSKEMDSNKAEILRLLLTLMSAPMYLEPTTMPDSELPWLNYIVCCSEKKKVLCILCSLLNTVSYFADTCAYSRP